MPTTARWQRLWPCLSAAGSGPSLSALATSCWVTVATVASLPGASVALPTESWIEGGGEVWCPGVRGCGEEQCVSTRPQGRTGAQG